MYAAIGAQRLVHVVATVRVTTENSVWLLRPDAGGQYLRMPRSEAGRQPTLAIDDALDDLSWLPFREVRLVRSTVGDRLRIVPAGRPDGSQGVITGVIVDTAPPIDQVLLPDGDSPDGVASALGSLDARSVSGDGAVEGDGDHLDRQCRPYRGGDAQGC